MNILRNLTFYNSKDLWNCDVDGRNHKFLFDFPGFYMLGFAFGNQKTYATQSPAKTAKACRKHFMKNFPFIAKWAILQNMEMQNEDWSIYTKAKGKALLEAKLNTKECFEIVRDIVIYEYGRF